MNWRRYHCVVWCWIVLSTPACAVTFDATSLGVPATMAAPAGTEVEGATFRLTHKAVYLLWGILPASRPSLEDVLAGQLVEGTGVANLRIRVSSRFTEMLIMTLTGGLVVPRSVTFEGTIVTDPEGTGETNPPGASK